MPHFLAVWYIDNIILLNHSWSLKDTEIEPSIAAKHANAGWGGEEYESRERISL